MESPIDDTPPNQITIDHSEPEFWNWLKSITNQFMNEPTGDWHTFIQQVAWEQGIHLEYNEQEYHEIVRIGFHQPRHLTYFKLVYNQIHERSQ